MLIILGWILIFNYACRSEEGTIIPPSAFTKMQREALGKEIKLAIAFEDERFPVLPNIPPYDTSIYFYIQTLYNQVTNEMRLDRRSPNSNKWNPERQWNITILKKEEKNAFIIPGGDLYMTTGLLKDLESEHELYYILAFEANLMNEKELLYELFNRFGTNILAKIADKETESMDITIQNLVEIMDQLSFDYDIVRSIDKETATLICQSSIMDRLGIIRLSEEHNNNWFWLNYRTNYGGRDTYVRTISVSEDIECGDFKTNGNYERYVLSHL